MTSSVFWLQGYSTKLNIVIIVSMAKWLLLSLSFLMMGASQGREDDRLTFVGYNMPPFYMRPDATGISGASFEIVQALCEREKLACRFTILPFGESMKNIADGKMEMGGPVAKTAEREKSYYFSGPIFHTGLAFFGLEKNIKKIHDYKDLSGLKIGVTNPSITLTTLNEINEGLHGKIKIIKERDPTVTVKMAELGTNQLAYLNRDYGRYWIKRYRSKIKEIPNLTKDLDYYLIFSRKAVTEKQFAAIDAQLKKMIEEKVVENIAIKHGLQAAEPSKATEAEPLGQSDHANGNKKTEGF
jgi:ABC-type amino acid transport substrate-binding protein